MVSNGLARFDAVRRDVDRVDGERMAGPFQHLPYSRYNIAHRDAAHASAIELAVVRLPTWSTGHGRVKVQIADIPGLPRCLTAAKNNYTWTFDGSCKVHQHPYSADI